METNNLSLYHIFLSVANQGNITKAAEELYISQPAVSKSIHRLESNLGISLFTRSTRGVTLTFEGQLLYEEVSKAFESIALGEKQLKDSATLGMGYIRIGVSSTLCKFVLLPYLNDFIRMYPHVRISIACQSTYETMHLLEEGKIDIGLVGSPEQLNGLDFHSLGEIEDVFVAAPQYLEHLKERIPKNPELTLEQMLMQNATLMLLNKENITRQYIDDYLREINLIPSNLIEVTSMDLLIDFAKIGLGTACVIKDFVKDELSQKTLTEIRLPLSIPKREIGFIYHNKGLSSIALQNFIQMVQL